MSLADLKDQFARLQRQKETDKARKQNEIFEFKLRTFRRDQLVQRQSLEKSLLIEVYLLCTSQCFHFIRFTSSEGFMAIRELKFTLKGNVSLLSVLEGVINTLVYSFM